jgi:hypothetical protein
MSPGASGRHAFIRFGEANFSWTRYTTMWSMPRLVSTLCPERHKALPTDGQRGR